VVTPEVLETMVGYSPDGVIVGIPDGQILYANPAACDLLGASDDELRRAGRQGITDSAHPAWRALLEERRRRGWTRGVAPMKRLDGSPPFLAEVASSIVEVPGGEERTCVIFRDVTAEVHEKRRLTAYDELAEALLSGIDTTGALILVAKHARIILDADAAVIKTSEPDGQIRVAAFDGPGLSGLEGRIYPSGSLGQEVMATKQAALYNDFAAVSRTEDGRRMGIGPAMALPIVDRERVFGVLFVGRRHGNPPYGVAALAEAAQFAARAALVLAIGDARGQEERHLRRTSEQLRQALDTRVVIEQAKGFLACRHGIDMDEAFDRLRKYARSHQADIHKVAASVVDGTAFP
jgi:PAS domain S-box-containing protein